MTNSESAAAWIINIIYSCKTGFHLLCAKKMIDLHFENYNDKELQDRMLELYEKKEAMYACF